MLNYLLCLALFINIVYSSTLPASNTASVNPVQRLKNFKTEIVAKAKEVKLPELNPFEVCICGALATAFGDLCLHPIDTIKTVQQASSIPISITKATSQIFKNGGLAGFYQGVVPYLLGDGLSGAVKFATFESAQSWVRKNIPEEYHPLASFICAAGAFVACSVILVPGEVVKIKIQSGQVKNIGEGITKVFAEAGLAGFYDGYAATLLRDVPYTMLELGLYENIKRIIRKRTQRDDLTQQEELSAAAVTGAATGYLTTPFDVIKTKIMASSGASISIASAFEATMTAGGLDGLFAGGGARVAWLLPFTTLYLGAYEYLRKSFLEKKMKEL